MPISIPLFFPILRRNTEFHRNEESHTPTTLRHRENWVSQGFLSDQCDSCIYPKNGGFDVRWVRFPKHIPLFFTLSQLEFVGLGDFSDWAQR